MDKGRILEIIATILTIIMIIYAGYIITGVQNEQIAKWVIENPNKTLIILN